MSVDRHGRRASVGPDSTTRCGSTLLSLECAPRMGRKDDNAASLAFWSISLALVLAAAAAPLSAQQGDTAQVAIDSDDIGGVVSSPTGPEAGVWVIAETTDLPTKFTRIVVTDDQGRYVIPDLPKAKYKVRVRGY